MNNIFPPCAGCGNPTSGKQCPVHKPICDTCLASIESTTGVMLKALGIVEQHIIKLPAPERSDLSSALLNVLIALLRDLEDDEFIRGYLDAALASLDSPKEFTFSLPH